MWHPFAEFTHVGLIWLFTATLIGTVFLFFTLESSAHRLRTRVAPRGIASLELADTQQQCNQIIPGLDDLIALLLTRSSNAIRSSSPGMTAPSSRPAGV